MDFAITQKGNRMDDSISRQAAIEAVSEGCQEWRGIFSRCEANLLSLPSAQPTLYGYKIEHLAYIARVMEKEGVTADYAVRTFDDISRALRMIIEEAQERVMETLDERHDLQTGGN